ncbi:MAG: HupE/UreJ family protein [Pseudomonadota bacterium]
MNSLCLLFSHSAWSHTTANHFFDLELDSQIFNGEILLAIPDIAHAIGLDANKNDVVTWNEITQSKNQINTYVYSHLKINVSSTTATKNCVLPDFSYALKDLSDSTYLSLEFKNACSFKELDKFESLTIKDSLFFEYDDQHKGILNFIHQNHSSAFIFTKDNNDLSIDLKDMSKQSAVKSAVISFMHEGMVHIWSGYDHLVFLLALILPIFSISTARFSHQFIDLVKIITAFSVAHSLTLSSVIFKWITIPSRIVESLIALSVIIAGLNVIWPIFKHKTWLVGLGFGLIHGFGFASAIGDLDWQQGQVLLNVFSFNVGVEIGQIVVVIFILPLLWSLKKSKKIDTLLNPILGATITGFGAFWLFERLI